MKTSRDIVVLVLGLYLLVSRVSAQQGIINGTVVWHGWQSGDHPVDSVIIVAYDSLNAQVEQDTSSAQGAFDFALVPGVYHFAFFKTGYRDTTLNNIAVIEAETTVIYLRLQWINPCHYVLGDVNGSNSFTGLDVTYSLRYFKGVGPPPPYSCECTPGHIWYVAGDVNRTGSFTGLDVVYMTRYYKGQGGVYPCPDCPPAP